MNQAQTELQPGQFIIIPGRISNEQFGCSPKVFNDHIKGKRILVVDKEGPFYTLYAARELWTAHAEILVSDELYEQTKQEERGEVESETQQAA